MIIILREHKKLEAADLLEGCATGVIFSMGAEVNAEQFYPNRSVFIVQALFMKCEYQKAVELGMYAIEHSTKLVKLLVVVGMAKIHYGNYSQGWDDMEVALNSLSQSYSEFYDEYWLCCFYLLPRLKYFNVCFGHRILNAVYIGLKWTIYMVFVQPLDVSNYVVEPTSFFPELEKRSSSKEVIASSYFHALANTIYEKAVVSYTQHIWLQAEILLNKFLLRHQCIRFIINVVSIVVRLDVITLLMIILVRCIRVFCTKCLKKMHRFLLSNYLRQFVPFYLTLVDITGDQFNISVDHCFTYYCFKFFYNETVVLYLRHAFFVLCFVYHVGFCYVTYNSISF